MKLEFLPDGSPDCPLLRLFDFSREEACELRQVFAELADGSRTTIDLRAMPVIVPINNCRLVLKVGTQDLGIIVAADEGFECVLKPQTWDNIAGLTEPFCERASSGYQWLTEHSDISLLLSPSGSW